jgi:hypothetical protein
MDRLKDSTLPKLAYLYIPSSTETWEEPERDSKNFKKYQTPEKACSTQSLTWKKQKYKKQKDLTGSSILVEILRDNDQMQTKKLEQARECLEFSLMRKLKLLQHEIS